jgi:PAS domain-containing protein
VPEQPLSTEEFSEIVGAIYDCALDPELWPDAIRRICAVTRCLWGSIAIHDLASRAMHLNQLWNCDPAWIEQTARYGPEISATWEAVPNLMARPLDEPLATSHHLPAGFAENSRYFNEVRIPAGLVDTLALMVMRRRDRIGSLGLQRHESVGVVGNREFEIMRLLAPHIRRAVAISDVLNMKTIHLDTLESILDLLQAAVLFVDRQCKIVYANRAAQMMLQSRAPIFSVRGELTLHAPRSAEALRRSVSAIGDRRRRHIDRPFRHRNSNGDA